MSVTADTRLREARSTPSPARLQSIPRALPLAPTLRRAGRGDAASILAFCHDAAGVARPETLPLPLREALFDTPCRSWAWLAEIGGQPVGLLLTSPGLSLPAGDYCLAIDALYVRPAWRGRGIGTRLREHAAAMAAEFGCTRLRLEDASVVPVPPSHAQR